MRRPWLLFALASCGGPSGGGTGAGPGDAAVPAARCDRPALHDVSSPPAVVGDERSSSKHRLRAVTATRPIRRSESRAGA